MGRKRGREGGEWWGRRKSRERRKREEGEGGREGGERMKGGVGEGVSGRV